jgi:hypothetical protein
MSEVANSTPNYTPGNLVPIDPVKPNRIIDFAKAMPKTLEQQGLECLLRIEHILMDIADNTRPCPSTAVVVSSKKHK